MNWVDIVIVVILVIGLFKGLSNGFVRGLFGLAALVFGIIVAAGNYEQVAEVLFSRLNVGEQAQAVLGFLLVFVIVMILITVVGRIIAKALKLASLGWMDRLAGGLLGIVMACLFIGAVLLVVAMAGFHTNTAVARSVTAPGVVSVVETVVVYAPDTAREMIEGNYVKLRIEWEKASQEPPPEEGEDEEDETVASVAPSVVPGASGARGMIGVAASGA
jgi:membrane protein required for colicin V production